MIRNVVRWHNFICNFLFLNKKILIRGTIAAKAAIVNTPHVCDSACDDSIPIVENVDINWSLPVKSNNGKKHNTAISSITINRYIV